ncbi:ABC-F type ribosomal protection protein [Halalkalibacterium halodurans]|uniref:ribosomal protection-like ABC-F family protein n=1 Tax=Halalkalibacterium halodurans TaxID=86665 RepID=UPI002E231ED6|nr:ABC-F type ribosomal protection protein [Halalkalibacterium halodurans]
MLLLEAKQLEKTYGDRQVIQAEELFVYEGDRIGVVGKNGEGKSTLLKMLAGVLASDGSGFVEAYGDIAYIPQLEDHDASLDGRVKKQWNVSQASNERMSGGEQTRKKIAQAFSTSAKILIADEPTSHLDLKGIEKLEAELIHFPGALILISHDRELLNRVCTSVWEVESGEVNQYDGNVDAYLQQKEHERERQQFEYVQFQKEKKRLEEAARKQSETSKSLGKAPKRMGNSEARLHKRSVGQKKAKLDNRAKAIRSRIEQLDVKEKPKEVKPIQFDVQTFQAMHSKTVLSFENVTIQVGESLLVSRISGSIQPGDKLAITGPNGAGKTTLLHLIEKANAPGIKLARPAVLATFHQRLEQLDEERSILENVSDSSAYEETFVRTVLARLLFREEEVHKKVGVLSGGERMKVALANVLLSQANVLLLDEPTNYLDLQSRQSLVDVLQAYPGTVVFVTHDRHLLQSVATHVLPLEKGVITEVGRRTTAPVMKKDKELLTIEIELTETISKLSITTDEAEKDALEKRYEQLLEKKRSLAKRS